MEICNHYNCHPARLSTNHLVLHDYTYQSVTDKSTNVTVGVIFLFVVNLFLHLFRLNIVTYCILCYLWNSYDDGLV